MSITKKNKKQILIRINKPENLKLFNEWEAKTIANVEEKSKNSALEDLLFKSIINEKLNSDADYLEEKFQKLFEKNTNLILKRVFGRQDIIALNLIKLLKIDEMKSNYLLNQLFEAGIIKDNTLIDPHKQQISDVPWVRKQKNNLDSEFAYIAQKEIIKDYTSITEESFVLQQDLKDDLDKTINQINQKVQNKIEKYDLKNHKKNKKEGSKNDN